MPKSSRGRRSPPHASHSTVNAEVKRASHEGQRQRISPEHCGQAGGSSTKHYALATCPPGYPRRLAGRVEQGFLYFVIRGNRLDGYAVSAAGLRTDHFTFRG